MSNPTLLALSLSLTLGCRKVPASSPPPEDVVLRIAAINDFHGGLYEVAVRDQDGVFGGLPWLVAGVRAMREEHPDLLLFDGGDAFQGSWPVNATKGRGSIHALSLLGVDAAAVGNHEFDYGGIEGGDPLRGALEAAVAAAPFPMLAANVFHEDGARYAPPNVLPWTLIERAGVKIAVVGLSTTDTPMTTLPAHVADLRFTDPVAAVTDLLPEIAASGAQVRILVAHLTGKCAPEAYVRNDDRCTPDGEIGRLLDELPPGTFDAMILGHAHTVLHHRVGDTFLLENRSAGHLVGQLELVVGRDGVDAETSRVLDPWPVQHAAVDPGCEGQPYPRDPIDVGGRTLAPDPEALALIERLEAEAGSLCDELACTSRTLTRNRTGESDLGSWMADAMLAAVDGAEVALTNSGGIRSDLPEGKVRRESLQRVMPFDNRLVLIEMTGADLGKTLRIGTSGAHGVLQVAGLGYGYDPARTGGTDVDGDGVVSDWEQDKLCGVTVGGAPLDPARTYRVVTTDFLHSGGDHLGPALSALPVVEQGPLLREALWDFAAQTTGCIGDAEVPARITVGACP